MNKQKTNRKWIHIRLEEKDFQEICGRYHYEDTDLVLMKEIYDKYLREKAVTAWFRTGYDANDNVAVLMTLGAATDERQNQLLEAGRMTEAYMLECLAMAVLERAYGQMDELLHEETGMWCVEYCFPGGEDMEQVADIVRVMEQEEVYCNHAYMLVPKKSVAYVAVLGEEKQAHECAMKVCAGCERKDCPNRAHTEEDVEKKNLNYGYQRIFGHSKR